MIERETRDPFAKTETEKAAFYRPGEEWRDLRPEGFKPATAETLRAEAEERRRIRELNASLEQVCVVCRSDIPAHEADFLLINEDTGERLLCCVHCMLPRSGANGSMLRRKYRSGITEGEELSEDEYRARVARLEQMKHIDETEGE